MACALFLRQRCPRGIDRQNIPTGSSPSSGGERTFPPQQSQPQHGPSSGCSADSSLHGPSCLQTYTNRPLEGTSNPLSGGGPAFEARKPSRGQMARDEASSTFVNNPLQRPSGQLHGRTNNNESTNTPMFTTTRTPNHPTAGPTTGRVDSAEQASYKHGESSNVELNGVSPREVIYEINTSARIPLSAAQNAAAANNC